MELYFMRFFSSFSPQSSPRSGTCHSADPKYSSPKHGTASSSRTYLQGSELISVIYIPLKNLFIFAELVEKTLYTSILSCFFSFNFCSGIIHIFFFQRSVRLPGTKFRGSQMWTYTSICLICNEWSVFCVQFPQQWMSFWSSEFVIMSMIYQNQRP